MAIIGTIGTADAAQHNGTPSSSLASGLSGLITTFQTRLVTKLTETGRNNPSLYYREQKASLELPPLDDLRIAALLAGEAIRPADWRPLAAPVVAEAATDGVADPETNGRRRFGAAPVEADDQKRLRALRAKAQEHADERGLQTLYAGLGLISWPADDGGRDPLAIMFVLPVEIVEDSKRRGEFMIRKTDGAELAFNPSLLEVVPAELRAELETIASSAAMDTLASAYVAAREAFARYGTYTLQARCVLRTFAFASLALVEDIRNAAELLESSPLALALAGDEAARVELTRECGERVDPFELDAIPAAQEAFILDADPSQAQAIHTILKFEAANAIVNGPPGTGKSQTIANAVAALIASGKQVLFVAEKRAALEVVQRRLGAVGLDHLILDLHGGDVTRSRVYARLREAVARVGRTPPAPATTMETTFDQRRATLNEHATFMHAPLSGGTFTPFSLIGRYMRVEAADLDVVFSGVTLDTLTESVATQLQSDLDEAASHPAVFVRDPATRWSLATFASADDARAVIAAIGAVRERVRTSRATLSAIDPARAPRTVDDLVQAGALVSAMLHVLETFAPTIASVDDDLIAAARDASASPLRYAFSVFRPRARTALRTIRQHQRDACDRRRLNAALTRLAQLPAAIRAAAHRIFSVDRDATQEAIATLEADLATLDARLGLPLPRELDALEAMLHDYARDESGAYRAARVREIEATLRSAGVGPVLDAIRERDTPPAQWRSAFEAAWLRSQLTRVMPRLATFDGRRHDRTVAEFCDFDQLRLKTAVARIARIAAERFTSLSATHAKERADLNVELGRSRKQKPIRELYTLAPHVLPSLVPCVMASPLSVSQLLPRRQLFDVVIFDEGSQVLPESAINAILRGKRVVVAGDEHQLPPTSFFAASDDEEDEDEASDALAGTESILDSIKSFATPLGLDVHYRSTDERLIAFSNEWIYDRRLVTFPGSGRDGTAIRHVFVDEPVREGDESSSSAEARRVVELIIAHAEASPTESLGVIAMGIKHARRIEAELLRARKERPELDEFFAESHADRFFVKNLERVQGDERDAIILSIGYGRTKTGSVTHNFGPVTSSGGERRLNVAITRAKQRITVVSSFRSTDLDPTKLRSRGAQLLGRYLRYAESGGADLGRDCAHDNTPLNEFEADVKTTLERRLGMQIVGQYGVGQYRIDLAVQSPHEPGRFLLAIECDGAAYHSTPTARMRDRLRQEILEARGWRFVRIWSTDWFERREDEILRIGEVYTALLQPPGQSTETPAPAVDEGDSPQSPADDNATVTAAFIERAGAPPIGRVLAIDHVDDRTLVALVRWIQGDGRLRDDEELLEETMRHLGFSRRGTKIVSRITSAIARARPFGTEARA